MSTRRQKEVRWRGSLLRLGLLSVIVFALATTVGAGPPLLDEPFEIVSGAGDITNPAIAYNWQQEQFLVAFHGNGAFSQVLLNKDGTDAGSTPFMIWQPGDHLALAYNGAANQYLRVWQEYDSASSQYKLWGIHLADNGEGIGSAFNIASSDYELRHPAIAFNTQYEDFLVVWEQHYVDLVWLPPDWILVTWEEVRAQRVAGVSGGAPGGADLIGENFGVADGFEPDVAYNPNMNEYLVVYTHWPDLLTARNVYSRRVTGDGALLSAQAVDQSANDQRNPSVAAFHWNQDTPYLVVYTDYSNDPAGDVRGHLLDEQARPQEVSIDIANDPRRQEQMPDVASSEPLGGYTVVWEQTENDWDVFGRRVRSDGALEEAFNISLYGQAIVVPCNEQAPVVAGGSPVAMAVWQDDCRGSPGSWDIFGRLLGYGIYLPLVMRNYP